MMKKIFASISFAALSFQALSQITINNTTVTPEYLVQNVLVGMGITVSNVKFNGSTAAALTPQVQVGEFSGTSSVNIGHGVILATGDAQMADSDNDNGGNTLPTGGTPGGGLGITTTDPDLNAISGLSLYDGAVLEFDFVPAGDSLKFKYVFASEEYLEWVGSGFNDVFGFFLSGPGISGTFSSGGINIAIVPGTIATPVSINTINDVWNAAYYVDNGDGSTPAINVNIQYDGFTAVITAKAAVQCGQTYHIKLAISDAGDGVLDSGVFLEAGSFSSDAVVVDLITTSGSDHIVEGCAQGGTFSFTRPSTTDTLTIPISISGTATNGVDYTPAIPSSITFYPGQDSVGIAFTAVLDGVTEGTDSLVITIVNINDCGDTIVSTATVYISDPQPLSVNLGPDLTLGCTGGTLNIDPNATGGYAPYTYTWSTGENTPTITHNVTGNEQIIVAVTGQCGTADSDTLNIAIVPPTPQLWNAPVFTSYCPTDTVTIGPQYVSGGSSPFTYNWTIGSSSQTVDVSPDDTTSYLLTITDFCGQDTTISITVNVRTPSPLDVQITSENLCRELDGTVVINSVVTGSNGQVQYTWYENGGPAMYSGASLVVPNAGAGGVFTVSVIDECYLVSVDTATIVVEDCVPVIPNIITPNGDGANDYFVIVNLERHPNTGLAIFNRWGQEIYRTDSYQNDWNGKNVNDGVYYYILTLTDGSDPAAYTGFVHVTGKK